VDGASWAEPKLQGFSHKHTKPCSLTLEKPPFLNTKSMTWGLFRANDLLAAQLGDKGEDLHFLTSRLLFTSKQSLLASLCEWMMKT
jgi:hypothetical protein